MGQAKRRGTYEQRVAQAIERDHGKPVTLVASEDGSRYVGVDMASGRDHAVMVAIEMSGRHILVIDDGPRLVNPNDYDFEIVKKFASHFKPCIATAIENLPQGRSRNP